MASLSHPLSYAPQPFEFTGNYGPSSLPGMSTLASPSISSSLTPATSDLSLEHSMGTTIMAVRFNGGVIMAADSRTSTGAYIANRASDKITSVHDKIFVCRSGSAADTQAVADMIRYYLSSHSIEIGEAPRVKTAANLFKQVVYQNKDRLSAGIIIGGYDEIDGGSVYSVSLGGSLVKQDVALGGSGSTYVYGLLDSEYNPGMTKEECLKFVRKAVSHAMARDGSSGGVIRTCVITKDGVEREMLPGNRLPFMAENAMF